LHAMHVTEDTDNRAAEHSAKSVLARNTQKHRPTNIERDVNRIFPAPSVNSIGDNCARTRRDFRRETFKSIQVREQRIEITSVLPAIIDRNCRAIRQDKIKMANKQLTYIMTC
jgi:hypothetical protein